MWKISLLLACTLSLTCLGDDSASEACAPNLDGATDAQCLLQSGVGIVNHHAEDQHKKLSKGHEDTGGFPDILKKLTNAAKTAMGGVDQLEKDFEAVKNSVGNFGTDVHKALAELTSHIKPSMSAEEIRAKTDTAYRAVHTAANKLLSAVTQIAHDFSTGIGKAAPPAFKKEMEGLLGHITKQAKQFADSFTHAADELKKVDKHAGTYDAKAVCAKIKEGLDKIHKKVAELISSTHGLTAKGFSKDFQKATNALPEPFKGEVEKVLKKANEAADHVKTLAKPVQEFADGVVKAFQGHCPGLHSSAGRTEIGLLSLSAIAMLTFAM